MHGEAGANDPSWNKPSNIMYFEVGKSQADRQIEFLALPQADFPL